MNTKDQSRKELPDTQGLSCDQVAWIYESLDRFIVAIHRREPSVSRKDVVAKLAVLLEIMEIVGVGFEDKSACGNAITGIPELFKLRK